jgi:hypothetical protein
MAYINGNFLVRGNNWRTAYTATILPQYLNPFGTNTLTVVAANWSIWAGVIYEIIGP